MSTNKSPLTASILLLVATFTASLVPAQTNTDAVTTNTPSLFRSPEDNWFDVSGFLEQKYGFIPLPIIITEPAIGYGGGAGLMFLSKPLPQTEDGLGRPNITVVGGFGTENDTWGSLAGDLRYWLDEHLQTFAGF